MRFDVTKSKVAAFVKCAALLSLCSAMTPASAQTPATAGNSNAAGQPTVVLVHGAFADQTSWNKVIPILDKDGIKTIAVDNPLTSLNADVDATNKAIAEAPGPVVLVGHSWAGMVITQAGDNPKVKALVYVAAFAPNKGESVDSLKKRSPAAKFHPDVIKDGSGMLRLSDESVAHDFANDLPASVAHHLAQIQLPWAASALQQPVTTVAWATKPSWDIITEEDHMIPPALQETMAEHIKAKILRLPSSHVVMISHPKQVASEILDAVNYVKAHP